jgi:hypothetical protein
LRSNTVPITDAENEMDLSWLADFVVLTESGSFSRAAARRDVTQLAFSGRIQEQSTRSAARQPRPGMRIMMASRD